MWIRTRALQRVLIGECCTQEHNTVYTYAKNFRLEKSCWGWEGERSLINHIHGLKWRAL